MPKTTGLTYKDLLEMFPEEDLVRRELIGGELFVSPSPGGRHQDAVTALVIALGLYAKDHGGKVYPGPRDVFFSEREVVEPDVLFVTPEHMDRAEERFVRGGPDLVVEISSPSTRRRDLTRKRSLYEEHGVREYWFVDLESHEVRVFRLTEEGYGSPAHLGRGEVLETPMLPGFSAPVDEVLGPPTG